APHGSSVGRCPLPPENLGLATGVKSGTDNRQNPLAPLPKVKLRAQAGFHTLGVTCCGVGLE
ncbi:MAG: hypothetical protein RLN85_01070, partial [Pseudomonadales bacterium]